MLHHILKTLDAWVGFEEARAHCDIPCGIYDPITAQIAALTVVRMIDLMTDLDKTAPDKNMDYRNSMARYVVVKEEHAEKAKQEIRIIYGDYIKALSLKNSQRSHPWSIKSSSSARKCARLLIENLPFSS